ncbi:MAG: hypothetical protein CMO81_08480 [Waddliaceae bacterium]|nr:hypothetical protein [Waddliaceae bacterium]
MDISLYIENTNGQISYTLKTNKNEESFIFRLNEEEFNFIIDFINPCKTFLSVSSEKRKEMFYDNGVCEGSENINKDVSIIKAKLSDYAIEEMNSLDSRNILSGIDSLYLEKNSCCSNNLLDGFVCF